MNSIILGRDEAMEIFPQIDANGNGKSSQIKFIKALRQDQALAKRLRLPTPTASAKSMKTANSLHLIMQILTRIKTMSFGFQS